MIGNEASEASVEVNAHKQYDWDTDPSASFMKIMSTETLIFELVLV